MKIINIEVIKRLKDYKFNFDNFIIEDSFIIFLNY